jgi:hypothetical protein
MFVASILVPKSRHDWASHASVGWVVVSFIWICVGAFGGDMGPCIVDVGIRNLPTLYLIQGCLHRRFEQLGQQFYCCVLRAANVCDLGLGNVYLLRRFSRCRYLH